jgi:hypothetical protein
MGAKDHGRIVGCRCKGLMRLVHDVVRYA